jgi:hypothetical protein
MSFHLKRHHETPPVDTDDDYAARLHDLTPMAPDDETRPSGQDRTAYHSPIESLLEPVDKPKWLKPHQHGRRHRDQSG